MSINSKRIKDVENVPAGKAAEIAAEHLRTELAGTPAVNAIDAATVARVECVVVNEPTFTISTFTDGTVRRDNRKL